LKRTVYIIQEHVTEHHQSHFSSSSVVLRAFSALCASYACIWRSGILLTPRLPLCEISFLWWPPFL